MRILDVEVVLHDPALRHLQMPAVLRLVPDGCQDARGFARLQDRNDLIGFGAFEIRIDEYVAAALRSLQDGRTPFPRSIDYPVLKLAGDIAQDIPADRILLTVGVKETDHPLGLLEGLDQPVEQDAIKIGRASCRE